MTLNEAIPGWASSGVFTAFQSLSVPWQAENIATQLDMLYHGNHSGAKPISPLVKNVMAGDTLSGTELTAIVTACLAKYAATWTKEYATLSLQYDPLSNYDVTEGGTDRNITDYASKDTTTPTTTQTASNMGFNSPAFVDTGKVTDGGKVELARSGQDVNTLIHDFSRSGNIGVTTSQQMLESERNLWLWNFFDDIVFPDVDRVFCSPVYDD